MSKDIILREKLAIERTRMSNQTTLLSYIRTALYFSVAGLSIKSLSQDPCMWWVDKAFFFGSFIVLSAGIYTFFAHKKRIKENKKHIGNYTGKYLQKE